MKIGVAGCGRMGRPMLAALRDAGFDARGYDLRSPESYGEFAGAMGDDPGGFGAELEVLISVVRDIPQTEDVLFSKGLGRIPSLRYLVISSTLSPRFVAALPARLPETLRLVDAPMSGAAVAAEERRLSFMLGGETADLDALDPLFRAMGRHLHRMGAYGAGMQSKVLNNLLAAASTATTRLVLDWAKSAGIDEARLLELIDTSSGQNWFASNFNEIEFARDGLADDNTIGILVKDIESALEAAPADADTDLPRAIQRALSGLEPRQ